ncbi:signal peptidase I [Catenovulum sp. SM1970]|uniref:signal peptidase I n=1 Tax=Marinifaba aquimaris TaxID=2741323 RepID=UPI0015744819|nr:signal peptidase I [Marinifaba aquimaris]NTS76423.1 signal peptidase I [Marinifaba aquimaris]
MAGYFSIFLTFATLITGVIWAIDYFVYAPKRKEKLAAAIAGNPELANVDEETKAKIAPQNAVAEFAEGIFPVVAFVFVLRSFLYEPFQIPSGSMMPTLLVGDFILVEKYAYGLKNPVTAKNIVEFDGPERGDIAVFKYPENPTLDYIKRVVGLPGDRIIYRNKHLFVLPKCDADATDCSRNYIQAKLEPTDEQGAFFQGPYPLEQYESNLLDVEHNILVNPAVADRVGAYFQQPSTQQDEWVVPEGQYFVLGDNRDNSTDSRFWGFVTREQLVGEAVAIWMSFEFNRPSDDWLPGFVPSDIRFSRLGGIENGAK